MVTFDKSELSALIEALEARPGSLIVAVVPGPSAKEPLLERLRSALAPLPLLEIDGGSGAIAEKLQSLRGDEWILLAPLLRPESPTATEIIRRKDRAPSSPAGKTRLVPEGVMGSLASSKARLLLLLSAESERLWAKELPPEALFFRFPEALEITQGSSRSAGQDGYSQAFYTARELDRMRQALRQARRDERQEWAREYALPLYRALLDSCLYDEASRLWEQELRDGQALEPLSWGERFELLRVRVVGLYDLSQKWGFLPYDPAAQKRWDRLTCVYLAEAKALVDEHPGLPELERELARAQDERSGFLRVHGSKHEALALSRGALEVFERLSRLHPLEPRWQRDRAEALRWLSYSLLAAGDAAEALRQVEAARELVERSSPPHPRDPWWQRQLALCYAQRTDAAAALKDHLLALESAEQLLALAQPQVEESPDQIGWLEYLLGAQLAAGIALMALGRRGQAMRSFHDAQQTCLRFFEYTGRYASGRLFGVVLGVLRGYLWLEDQRWYQAISNLRLAATEGLRSLARLGRAEDKPKQLEAKTPKP
jgi:tetratricopeptide (TPR) repeat protein